jgi:hypothetical protein
LNLGVPIEDGASGATEESIEGAIGFIRTLYALVYEQVQRSWDDVLEHASHHITKQVCK